MKVLLVPLGSRGDVQPQLVLGEELGRRGHRVTVAAPPNFRGWVESYGFAFVPVGEDIRQVMLDNRGMTEQHPAIALPAQIALTRRHTVRQTQDLFAVDHDADVVVSAGLSFVGKMVADKLKVPYVFCCYSLSAMYSAEHPPAVVPVFGLPRLAWTEASECRNVLARSGSSGTSWGSSKGGSCVETVNEVAHGPEEVDGFRVELGCMLAS